MILLISGAAGLIGAELAGALAERGHGVIGLVHRSRDLFRNDGRPIATGEWRGKAPAPGEVLLVSGDVTRPGLGIAQPIEADLIIHCAALTAFDATLDAYRAVNVDGTAHMLALAPGAGFLHVSTAYVCGERDGPVPEAALTGQRFANGYEASKAEAEALVRASGRRFAIARPSIVLGRHSDGAIRSFDTIYAAFKLIAEGRIRAMPVSVGATLDFVPIDHVVGGLIDIAEHFDAAAGNTLHLVAPAPVPVETFRAAIAGYPQFSAPRFVDPASFDPAGLPPLERRLHARVSALYASYFQRDPRFEAANLTALSGRECPPMDAAALGRMIDYCIRAGFLPSAHPDSAAPVARARRGTTASRP